MYVYVFDLGPRSEYVMNLEVEFGGVCLVLFMFRAVVIYDIAYTVYFMAGI